MSGSGQEWVLAVDVGGTKTALAAVGPDGDLRHRQTVVTRVSGDDVARVAGLVVDAVTAWGTPAAIGTGWPEYVSPDGRLTSDEVLSWQRQPGEVITEAVQRAGPVGIPVASPVDIPVVVESDVRLGALGEARFGAGRGAHAMAYVSLGTGLSSTLVLDGRCWPGARGEAIGFGEWPVPASLAPRPAPRETLEPYCSGAGLAARYRELTGAAVSTRDLVERCAGGDALACEVLDSGAQALGLALAALVAVFDPSVVVLGGGLGSSGAPFLDVVGSTYAARHHARPSAPPLVTATTGADAGLLGAAAAALGALNAAG